MTPEQYDLVEAVFEAACELPPADRTAMIDARCGDDVVVRAAVESMLAADEADDEAFSPPALPLADRTQVLDENVARREQSIPERIGRYRIVRECGHGGMGVVYEAEQDSPARRVALKVVRTGVVSRQLLRRFRREAEVLGRLQHPGIAQIFEAGSFDVGEGGQPFFAMEFIEGASLIAHATRHGLDVQARLELFLHVCDAVHYAHQMGVIHRDLKPDNVLVDAKGHPKVLDFGIARMTDADVQMTTMQTDVGQLVGTIQYMSPEQTTGDSRELDTRSDVYALGVMLFELLAERLPHDLQNRSIPESVLVIRQDEPKRLSSIDSMFRGDLDTIVGKCLEKEPSRRYESAADLAEDVRRHLRDEPIAARPPSAMYQLRKFAQRNRALVAGTIATILTLVAGVIVASVLAVRASHLADVSASNEATARAQAYRAEIVAAHGLIETDPAGAKARLENAPVEHRNWEWRHLMHRLTAQLDDLAAGGAIVGRPGLAADGAVVALRSDGAVVRWERDRPEERTTLAEFGVRVRAGRNQHARPVAFSDGARRVAFVTADGELRAHDLATNTPIDLPPLPGGVVAAAFAWDSGGERLVAAQPASISTWSEGRGWIVRPIETQAAAHVRAPTRLVELCVVPGADRAICLARDGSDTWLVSVDLSSGRVVSTHEHDEVPLTLAVSSDGRRVAVGYLFRSVRLLDPETLEVVSLIGGHLNEVRCVGFSPDGELLCSAGADDTIRLWDLTEKRPQAVLHSGSPWHTMYSADGATLLCLEVALEADSRLDAPDRVRRWDVSGDASRILRGHETYVYDVAWSHDGTRLASIDHDHRATLIWEADAGRLIQRVPPTGWLMFRRDGLFVGHTDDQLILVDVDTGEIERRPIERRSVLEHASHDEILGEPAVRPSEHAIWRTDYSTTAARGFGLRAAVDGTVIGQKQRPLHRPGPTPHPLFIGADDWAFDGSIAELIILDGQPSDDDAEAIERYLAQRRDLGHSVWPSISSASIAARFVADAATTTSDAEGRVTAWSATNDPRIVLRVIDGESHGVRLDETAMNGHPSLVFGGRMGTALPDDLRLGDVTVYWLGYYRPGASSGVAYSIGLRGARDPALRGELREVMNGSLAGVRLSTATAVSADGILADLSPYGITLVDDDGVRGRIPGAYHSLAFHPGGAHLALGSASGVIEIRDVVSLEKIDELAGHQGIVYGVDYGPDGTRLVSGGNDTTIRVWDVVHGEQVLELRGHESYVKAVVFSPDGSKIASASGDASVRIWDSAEPAP